MCDYSMILPILYKAAREGDTLHSVKKVDKSVKLSQVGKLRAFNH